MNIMVNLGKNILLFIVLLFCKQMSAQTYDWAWVQRYGDNNYESGTSLALDANGNIYLCGAFASPSISFGNISLTNSNIAGGVNDAFVAKFSNNGTPIWAFKIGGTGNDVAHSIGVDGQGNCYVIGNFQSTSINIGGNTFTNPGGSTNLFVAKLSPAGVYYWSIRGNGMGNSGMSIAVDSIGNSFITGDFSNQFQLGSLALGGLSEGDGFVGKINNSGTPVWIKKFGGISGADFGRSVCTDGNGNSFVTGYFQCDYLNIGGLSIPNSDLNSGSLDMFLAKFDSSGNALWAIPGGETNAYDYGMNVHCDASGNVYATGYFYSANITFQSTNLVNSGNNTTDVFVVKYSSAGSLQWAKSAGGAGNDFSSAVSTDAAGNTYLIGAYENQTFNIGTVSLPNSGLADIFVAQYDPSGNVVWAKKAAGTGYDWGADIVVDDNGSCYATGYFWGSANFGTINPQGGFGTEVFLGNLSLVSNLPESIANDEFSIFPNPSNENISMIFGEEQNNSILRIIDLQGKKILETQFSGRQITLENQHMAKGVYYVQILKADEILSVKKLMIH
jgi:hypothetical protein